MCRITVFIVLFALALSAYATPSHYDALNPVCPGYGPEPFDGGSYHVPRAYALAAMAYTRDGMIDEAKRAADWLAGNADLNEDGLDGWGYAFAADAFSDGTINPPHTVYGITTAVAALALMDVYEATNETRYLDAAVSALADYARFSKGGVFEYSASGYDATPVYNVTAMMMGALARAARLAGREDFRRIAEKSYVYLMGIAHEDGDALWWGYGDHSPGRQDLKHAAYMATGLIEYQAPAGIVAKAVNELRNFYRNGEWSNWADRDNQAAEVIGLSETLASACRVGDPVLEASVRSALPDYLKGRFYVNLPNETNFALRHHLAVAAALAACN